MNANQNKVPYQILKPEVLEELSKPLGDGLKYHLIIDRLNDVLHKYELEWTTQDSINVVAPLVIKSVKGYSGRITIMFLDENRNVVASRHCYGDGETANDAFENAFIETARLFGIGKE